MAVEYTSLYDLVTLCKMLVAGWIGNVTPSPRMPRISGPYKDMVDSTVAWQTAQELCGQWNASPSSYSQKQVLGRKNPDIYERV